MNVKGLLSRLIGNKNILSNNVLFIDYVGGNHSKAQFLSQLFYWTGKSKRNDGFFAKTYEEWYEEIRVKQKSIQRYSAEFQAKGFLETKVLKFNGYPTVHYKLDMDNLTNSLWSFCQNPSGQFDQNDMDTVTNSKDMDNLTRNSNRDYHKLRTETTNRKGVASALEKNGTPLNDKTEGKSDFSRAVSLETKQSKGEDSSLCFEQLAAKCRVIEAAHLKNAVIEESEIFAEPESWLEAIEVVIEYYETEVGKKELHAQLKGADVPEDKFDSFPVRQVLTKFFGKNKMKPHIWKNPLHYTASLTGWFHTHWTYVVNSSSFNLKVASKNKGNEVSALKEAGVYDGPMIQYQ